MYSRYFFEKNAYLEEVEGPFRAISPVHVHGPDVLPLPRLGNRADVKPAVFPPGTPNHEEVFEQAHALAETVSRSRLLEGNVHLNRTHDTPGIIVKIICAPSHSHARTHRKRILFFSRLVASLPPHSPKAVANHCERGGGFVGVLLEPNGHPYWLKIFLLNWD